MQAKQVASKASKGKRRKQKQEANNAREIEWRANPYAWAQLTRII